MNLHTETFPCQCLSEMIAISFDDEIPDSIFVSWWQQQGCGHSLWARIQLAWDIVVHNHGWMDEIVLDHADSLRLIQALRRAVHVVWSEEEEERLRSKESNLRRADMRKITEEIE